MTTYVLFQPSATVNFTFQTTFVDLQGNTNSYNLVVTWNYGGQRYYLNCYDNSGTLVYCLPMIGSPDDFDININGGYFQTSLVFRASSQNFEIT
jgi:hypothetical protein